MARHPVEVLDPLVPLLDRRRYSLTNVSTVVRISVRIALVILRSTSNDSAAVG